MHQPKKDLHMLKMDLKTIIAILLKAHKRIKLQNRFLTRKTVEPANRQ